MHSIPLHWEYLPPDATLPGNKHLFCLLRGALRLSTVSVAQLFELPDDFLTNDSARWTPRSLYLAAKFVAWSLCERGERTSTICFASPWSRRE